jgi:hypothetical protein
MGTAVRVGCPQRATVTRTIHGQQTVLDALSNGSRGPLWKPLRLADQMTKDDEPSESEVGLSL